MYDFSWLVSAIIVGIVCGALVGIWMALLEILKVMKENQRSNPTYSLMSLQNELLVKLFSEGAKKK